MKTPFIQRGISFKQGKEKQLCTQCTELSAGGQGRGQTGHDAPVGGKVEPEVQQAGDQVHGGAGQDAAVRQQVFGALRRGGGSVTRA